jgi:hypothetical protein
VTGEIGQSPCDQGLRGGRPVVPPAHAVPAGLAGRTSRPSAPERGLAGGRRHRVGHAQWPPAWKNRTATHYAPTSAIPCCGTPPLRLSLAPGVAEFGPASPQAPTEATQLPAAFASVRRGAGQALLSSTWSGELAIFGRCSRRAHGCYAGCGGCEPGRAGEPELTRSSDAVNVQLDNLDLSVINLTYRSQWLRSGQPRRSGSVTRIPFDAEELNPVRGQAAPGQSGARGRQLAPAETGWDEIDLGPCASRRARRNSG